MFETIRKKSIFVTSLAALLALSGCSSGSGDLGESVSPDKALESDGSSWIESVLIAPQADTGCTNPNGTPCGGGGSSGGYGSGGGGFAPAAFSQTFPAVCAPKPTTIFENHKQVSRIEASGNGANGVKGKVTFSVAISGILPGMKLNDLVTGSTNPVHGAGDNGPGPYTVLGVSIANNQTVVTVAEATKGVSSPSEVYANIEYQFEQLKPDCSESGISPLYINGTGFPRSDESGVTMKMKLFATGYPGGGECELFILTGSRYRWVDMTNAMWDVPAFVPAINWSTTPGAIAGVSGSKTNTAGQVNPAMGGCNVSTISGRMVQLSIGSSMRVYSAYSTTGVAFIYGARQAYVAKPQIDYVCATKRTDWDAGLISSDCSPNGSGGSGLNGDIKARTGDILTVVGRNFQRKNAAALCPAYNPACARKKIQLEVKVAVGGVNVGNDAEHIFALVNGAKNDLRNGECVNDALAAGGTCQRIHVVVPQIPKPNRSPLFLFVGVAAQNPNNDRDQYGGHSALNLGDPGDRKVKYYGGELIDPPVTPLPTPSPLPVRIVSALPDGTSAIRVAFEEVADDPNSANLATPNPHEGEKVDHYELKAQGDALYYLGITNDTQFNSATSYPGPSSDLLGQIPGSIREVKFSGLSADRKYCFSAKAVDGDGKISALRVPAGDNIPPSNFYPVGAFCAKTDAIPVNAPPCAIHLDGEQGGDPTTELRLFWVEPSADGQISQNVCTSIGSTPVSALEMKYRPGASPISQLEFDAGTGLISVAIPPSEIVSPGITHQKLLGSLTPNSAYTFVIRASDGNSYSPISNSLTLTTAPIVPPVLHGTAEFINLSANLPPFSSNIGHTIDVLANASGTGLPWVLISGPETAVFDLAEPLSPLDGIQIYKVAEQSLNVCSNCALSVDELPLGGDGIADLIVRDRHALRSGLGRDCNGLNLDLRTPAEIMASPNWSLVDTFAQCNLPNLGIYGKAQAMEVGNVNADGLPDIVVANNGSAAAERDPIYINSGSDTCSTYPNGSSRIDVADGIPCFRNPVDLPLARDRNGNPIQKEISARARLYSAFGGSGGADLIAMVTDVASLAGVIFYKNDCKNKLGACSAGDFSPVTTSVLDVGGSALLPLYCEDVAFVDLNNDSMKDMICVRTNNFTTARENGVNLVFLASMNSTTGLPLFTYRANSNMLGSTFESDCNSSFVETAASNGRDYILIGYSKIGDLSGQGTACKTQLLSGSNGSFTEHNLLGMDNNVSCHNGVLADSGARNLRTGAALDVALSCGLPGDMDSDFTYRGPRLFVNNGSNTFAPFESSSAPKVFSPALNANGSPIRPATANIAAPLVYDGLSVFGPYVPGAVNAVGVGDLDGDGVPDLMFGTGRISTLGKNFDYFFKHIAQ